MFITHCTSRSKSRFLGHKTCCRIKSFEEEKFHLELMHCKLLSGLNSYEIARFYLTMILINQVSKFGLGALFVYLMKSRRNVVGKFYTIKLFQIRKLPWHRTAFCLTGTSLGSETIRVRNQVGLDELCLFQVKQFEVVKKFVNLTEDLTKSCPII